MRSSADENEKENATNIGTKLMVVVVDGDLGSYGCVVVPVTTF